MNDPFIVDRNRVVQTWVIYFGIAASVAGLIFLAYLGIYNRYWSDDWCYNRDFQDIGVGGTVKTYFITGEAALRGYSTNRYSLTLLSGLLFLTGIFGAQITAALVILAWITGLLWVLANLSKIYGFSSKPILLLGALNILFYTLYFSPQRFQILYWMAGIHYSFSIIAGLYLAGLVTYQVQRETHSKVADILAFPLAFLAGGFSETGCAYLISCATPALLMTIGWRRKKAIWALKAFPTLALIFLGLVCSLAALVLSPSNEARLDTFSGDRTPLLTTLLTSFQFSYHFIIDSLRSLPLPHMMFVISFLSLSIISTSETLPSPDIQKRLWMILAAAFIVWLLIAAIQAPTVYVYKTPPDPRGQSLARFTMFAGLAVIGWLCGRSVVGAGHGAWVTMLSLLGLMFSTVYTVRIVSYLSAELPGFIERAALWDQRDADIRQARQQGITRLEVVVIDMKDVGTRDIMDSVQMNDWATSCASEYYGLEEFKAISP